MANRTTTDARGAFCPGPLMELIAALKKNRRFNRITGGMAGTIPPKRGFEQGHQEGRRGGNRRGNARMSGSREDSRVVGEGNAQEPTPSPVALVDGEVRYH